MVKDPVRVTKEEKDQEKKSMHRLHQREKASSRAKEEQVILRGISQRASPTKEKERRKENLPGHRLRRLPTISATTMPEDSKEESDDPKDLAVN